MQGTVFTLARLKIIPTIKNLICRRLLYDCTCDAVVNYMFLTDSLTTGVSGWIAIWGSKQELHIFTVLAGVRLNKLKPTT